MVKLSLCTNHIILYVENPKDLPLAHTHEFSLLIYCWEFLHMYFSDMLTVVSFTCSVLIQIWYEVMLTWWVWEYSFSSIFGKSLRRVGIHYSLDVWYPIDPGLYFVEKFLITASVSFMILGLLRFSISSDLVLVGLMFLGIFPFSLGCSICWCIIAHRSLFDQIGIPSNSTRIHILFKHTWDIIQDKSYVKAHSKS